MHGGTPAHVRAAAASKDLHTDRLQESRNQPCQPKTTSPLASQPGSRSRLHHDLTKTTIIIKKERLIRRLGLYTVLIGSPLSIHPQIGFTSLTSHSLTNDLRVRNGRWIPPPPAVRITLRIARGIFLRAEGGGGFETSIHCRPSPFWPFE